MLLPAAGVNSEHSITAGVKSGHSTTTDTPKSLESSAFPGVSGQLAVDPPDVQTSSTGKWLDETVLSPFSYATNEFSNTLPVPKNLRNEATR